MALRLEPDVAPVSGDHGAPVGTTFFVADVPIRAADFPEAVALLDSLRLTSGGHDVHLCNAYSLTSAAKNAALRAVFAQSTLNFPDGTPLAWIARLSRQAAITGPVRGPALMLRVLEDGIARGATHVFYGGSPVTVERLERFIVERFPEANLLWVHSPPYRDLTPEEEVSLVSTLRRLEPDYVWIGLGTPRQDFFCAQMAAQVPSIFVAVGAAFDFAAGTVREAPAMLHGTGLEWVYRLLQEPRRLWRRYLIGNVEFLPVFTRAILHRR